MLEDYTSNCAIKDTKKPSRTFRLRAILFSLSLCLRFIQSDGLNDMTVMNH